MGTRPERIKEALRREISIIIQTEITDPRVGFVTITRVEVSKDLEHAYVYYSVMGKEKDAKDTKYALESAAGYVRKLVADRVKMRYVPNLTFRPDKTMEHTRRIYEILDDIKKERKDHGSGEGDRDDQEIR